MHNQGDEMSLKIQKNSNRCDCCYEAPQKPAVLRVCAACRKAFYCDTTCQTNHWKVHKPLCKRIQQALKEGDAGRMALVTEVLTENAELGQGAAAAVIRTMPRHKQITIAAEGKETPSEPNSEESQLQLAVQIYVSSKFLQHNYISDSKEVQEITAKIWTQCLEQFPNAPKKEVLVAVLACLYTNFFPYWHQTFKDFILAKLPDSEKLISRTEANLTLSKAVISLRRTHIKVLESLKTGDALLNSVFPLEKAFDNGGRGEKHLQLLVDRLLKTTLTDENLCPHYQTLTAHCFKHSDPACYKALRQIAAASKYLKFIDFVEEYPFRIER